MNMKNVKLLALILALLLALAVVFVGCTPSDSPEITDNPSAGDTTAPAETEPIPQEPAELTIVAGGVANFKIVRPSNLDTTAMPVRVAIDIRKAINNFTNVSLELADDWIKPGQEHDSESCEILIGNTSYPETAEVMNSINSMAYSSPDCLIISIIVSGMMRLKP